MADSNEYVSNDKRFVDNLAPNVSPAYLGNVYSGRSVDLSGGGYVSLPDIGRYIIYYDFTQKKHVQIDTTTGLEV